MTELELSIAIEELLVARNLRGMQHARAALEPGYYLRAASKLRDIHGTVLIGTGFPVSGTFETDGPVGAIALYDTLLTLGADPMLACGAPLSESIKGDYRLLELFARDLASARQEAAETLRVAYPRPAIRYDAQKRPE